ncbi:MAG: hypothetical protein J0647_04390 [Campylobacteraceae bacterium]|nr:hypothetical protein [Campylobacteraceae bacterium]
MKKIILSASIATAFVLLTGCSDSSAPECGNDDVKQMVFKNLDKELKESLIMGVFQTKYPVEAMELNMKLNTASMVQSMMPGLDATKGVKYPKSFLELKKNMEDKMFPAMKVDLTTIQSTKIDEKIKRSECTANLTVYMSGKKDLDPLSLPITYSAQRTDDGKELIVKASFNSDNSKDSSDNTTETEE